MKNTNQGRGKEETRNQSKGFASMPHEKVEEIPRKGRRAGSEKAGHEGMTERGRKGGVAPHESRPRKSRSQNEEEEEN